jgi:hypothetical protein
MANFAKRNRQPVPVELFGAAVEVIASLPARERTNTASRIVALMRMMDAYDVPPALEARNALLMSIQLRLHALQQLQNQPSYRVWSMKSGTSGTYYVHAAVIAAAARAPLDITGRVAHFEPRSFFELVLAISEAQGHG